MRFARGVVIALMCLIVAGCGENLFPSGTDERPPVDTGTAGPGVGQTAPAFSVPDTDGTPVTLDAARAGKKAIVLYFTMWCPICDSHLSNMAASVIPANGDVAFYAVDYVSGSVSGARDAMFTNGFADSGLTVLADIDHSLTTTYRGTMGITIVIDSTGVVRMNEDYRDGAHLRAVLAELP